MPGPAANLFGDLFGGVSSPTVPKLPKITLPQQQGQAIAADQASLSANEGLVSSANTFSQSQIESMLNASIPGWSNTAATAGADIASEVSGQLPADVAAEIQNSSAAQALTGGFGGSGAAGNLVARDLGLSTLQLTNQGLSSAENWMRGSAAVFEPSMANVQQSFITPEQQYQATNQQNEEQWNAQWLQNQVSAAGNPLGVAAGQLFGGIADSAASAVVGYFGGSVPNSPAPGSMGSYGGSGGEDFAFSSPTSDMFDSGFDYGGVSASPDDSQLLDAGAGFGTGFGGVA